jgi:hypothetical protein
MLNSLKITVPRGFSLDCFGQDKEKANSSGNFLKNRKRTLYSKIKTHGMRKETLSSEKQI